MEGKDCKYPLSEEEKKSIESFPGVIEDEKSGCSSCLSVVIVAIIIVVSCI